MASYKVRKARRHYVCASIDWFHDRRIRPGDETLVITYFKTDWEVHAERREPLSSIRLCMHCLANHRVTAPNN